MTKEAPATQEATAAQEKKSKSRATPGRRPSDHRPRFDAEEREARPMCRRCLRSQDACLCDVIEPFSTSIHFVVLMHPKEVRNSRGTGRLALKSLRNSQLIRGIDFSEDPKVNALLQDPDKQCFLLYPGTQATNLSLPLETQQDKPATALLQAQDKERVVFLIDGTWPCAKKMMRLSKNLHHLPRVCFTPTERSRFLIKKQPNPHCLSTIEAIHQLLDAMATHQICQIEPPDAHHQLPRLLDRLVQFHIECAQDPARRGYRRAPYKPKDKRTPSKKWSQRSFFYLDEPS